MKVGLCFYGLFTNKGSSNWCYKNKKIYNNDTFGRSSWKTNYDISLNEPEIKKSKLADEDIEILEVINMKLVKNVKTYTEKINNEIEKMYNDAWSIRSFKKYIIDKYDTDVFCHSGINKESNELIKNILKPKKYIFEEYGEKIKKKVNENDKYKKYSNERYHKIKCFMYSRMKVIELLELYMNEKKIEYDVIILTQYDLLLLNDIDLYNIDSRNIYTLNWNQIIGGHYNKRNLIDTNINSSLKFYTKLFEDNMKKYGKCKEHSEKDVDILKKSDWSQLYNSCYNSVSDGPFYEILKKYKNWEDFVNISSDCKNSIEKKLELNSMTFASFINNYWSNDNNNYNGHIYNFIALNDSFYISNIENMKIISKCYLKMIENENYLKYEENWHGIVNKDKKKPLSSHSFISKHLIEENILHKIRFSLYDNIDIIKVKFMEKVSGHIMFQKCIFSSLYKSDKYLNFDKNIIDINKYNELLKINRIIDKIDDRKKKNVLKIINNTRINYIEKIKYDIKLMENYLTKEDEKYIEVQKKIVMDKILLKMYNDDNFKNIRDQHVFKKKKKNGEIIKNINENKLINFFENEIEELLKIFLNKEKELVNTINESIKN